MSAYIIAAIDRLDLVKYKEYSVRCARGPGHGRSHHLGGG